MESLGFDTNRDSLIINVVKCRPPGNRRPTPQEVASCFPFLKKQVDWVRPKAVLLLGATALKHVAPDKKNFKMAQEVGSFFTQPDYPGVDFMVVYHPAYILRDRRKMPVMLEHLKRFIEKARGARCD